MLTCLMDPPWFGLRPFPCVMGSYLRLDFKSPQSMPDEMEVISLVFKSSTCYNSTQMLPHVPINHDLWKQTQTQATCPIFISRCQRASLQDLQFPISEGSECRSQDKVQIVCHGTNARVFYFLSPPRCDRIEQFARMLPLDDLTQREKL